MSDTTGHYSPGPFAVCPRCFGSTDTGGRCIAGCKGKPSSIESVLSIARDLHPDLWDRTEAVAKIIDPSAFADGWVVHPEESAKLLASRLAYLRANAMRRAQEVLEYLGVNTATDWMEILTRLAEVDRR